MFLNEDAAVLKLQELYKELGCDDKMITVKSLNQYLKDEIRKEKKLQNLLFAFVLIVVFISVALQTIRLMRTNPAVVLKKE